MIKQIKRKQRGVILWVEKFKQGGRQGTEEMKAWGKEGLTRIKKVHRNPLESEKSTSLQ